MHTAHVSESRQALYIGDDQSKPWAGRNDPIPRLPISILHPCRQSDTSGSVMLLPVHSAQGVHAPQWKLDVFLGTASHKIGASPNLRVPKTVCARTRAFKWYSRFWPGQATRIIRSVPFGHRCARAYLRKVNLAAAPSKPIAQLVTPAVAHYGQRFPPPTTHIAARSRSPRM